MTANDGLVVIKHDVYDVAKALKHIDKAYTVCYNTAKCRYEVHNSRQKGNTFCLVVPYEQLDCRTIDYVNKTRIQNISALMEQMDKQNKQLTDKLIAKQAEQMCDALQRGYV